jgi:hypothetical protein
LAKKHGIAMQIHDRDAHDAVLETLDRVGAPERTVFHCFSGDADMARIAADRGYWLSFAGNITFKNAQNLRDALAVTPRERILVETDAPFLTPTPLRGRPNAPYLVPVTVRFMAEELRMPLDELCAQVASNTSPSTAPSRTDRVGRRALGSHRRERRAARDHSSSCRPGARGSLPRRGIRVRRAQRRVGAHDAPCGDEGLAARVELPAAAPSQVRRASKPRRVSSPRRPVCGSRPRISFSSGGSSRNPPSSISTPPGSPTTTISTSIRSRYASEWVSVEELFRRAAPEMAGPWADRLDELGRDLVQRIEERRIHPHPSSDADVGC